MTNIVLARVLGLFGACCIAAAVYIIAVYDGDKVIMIGLLGGVSTTFVTALLSLRQGIASNQQSVDNADAIQAVHTIVNSQKTAMQATIDRLEATIASLEPHE
jgi:hypothetical protein